MSLQGSRQWSPWCGCQCHSNPYYKHFAPCCCAHRIDFSVDCPECCSLPRNADGSCEEHNHHSQYNKAWGRGDWVLSSPVDPDDPDSETIEEHIRRLLDEQD